MVQPCNEALPGGPSQTAKMGQINLPKPALACEVAAEDAANDLQYVFDPKNDQLAALAPSDIPQRLIKAKRAFMGLIDSKRSSMPIEEVKASALSEKAVGAVQYMLACSPKLVHSIKQFTKKMGTVPANYPDQLNAFLRYYLNDALATQNFSLYGPAVARAQVLRRKSYEITRQIDQALAEVKFNLGETPLGLPPVASALVQRAKGNPIAIIEEALYFREKARTLRRWLAHKLNRYDLASADGQFEAQRAIKELINLMKSALGLEKELKFREAVELLFILGVPAPSVKGAKLVEWIESRLKRRKIAVLSEISKASAFVVDPNAYKKLEENCCKNRKPYH